MVPYIDMHCDTLMRAWMRRRSDLLHLKGMVDLARLGAGGCKAQFFAVFLPPVELVRRLGPLFPSDEDYIKKCIAIFHHTARLHPDLLAQAKTFEEIEKNAAAGKLSGILTLEDGRAVNGRMEHLDRFYRMGIRLISLTWNAPNCFGEPNGSSGGLTPFGREAVAHMNRIGMMVDVSHLSDRGFSEVAEICRQNGKPFVASHSNCRALTPHPRNLTDEMIRALADCGGVIGVNFGPDFLEQGQPRFRKESRIAAIVAHLKHMIRIGGTDCAAIGTDFDGINGRLEIGSADRMPLLFEALEREGFAADAIEKIAFRNVERVLREVLQAQNQKLQA